MSFQRLTVSALFVAGLLAVSAVGQPPGGADKPPDPNQKKPLGEKVKPADPADAAVTAALANDPDVRVARAKVQLAEAEVAKAKQAVVLKVMTLNAAIKELKRSVEAAQERVAWTARMVQTGNVPQAQLLDERAKLESAQAALAKAETELKLLTGGADREPGVVELPGGNAETVARGIEWLLRAQGEGNARHEAALERLALEVLGQKHAVQGPIPDRIRAALDKPVKLAPKGEKVTFEQALAVFKKEAGFDVPVRGPGDLVRSPVIVSQGEELPVGAWFQLFQDYTGGAILYVRDYGLLLTDKSAAPPDAPTLTEFWKQKPPAKKDADPDAAKKP